jgi:hypothetical protein
MDSSGNLVAAESLALVRSRILQNVESFDCVHVLASVATTQPLEIKGSISFAALYLPLIPESMTLLWMF